MTKDELEKEYKKQMRRYIIIIVANAMLVVGSIGVLIGALCK